MFNGACRSLSARVASSRMTLVNGTRSIVTSFGRFCSGMSALSTAAVCSGGKCMGVMCSESGEISLCDVDSAVMMGMLTVCMRK